jgi:hypothetical protein
MDARILYTEFEIRENKYMGFCGECLQESVKLGAKLGFIALSNGIQGRDIRKHLIGRMLEILKSM